MGEANRIERTTSTMLRDAEQDELGQALTGSFGIAFTQVFTDDRIASGGKHGADGNGQRDDGKDDVERR